jgi:hypothetical protein
MGALTEAVALMGVHLNGSSGLVHRRFGQFVALGV